MTAVLERIAAIGVVPVIRIDDVEKAVPLALALMDGGLPCAEITFRTAEAGESIRRISAEVPDILLGAGTVLTPEQVDRASIAGAGFVVTPGFNFRVVSRSLDLGVPIVPGCSTPTDMEQAIECGLDAVKVFPAEQVGGLGFIKAVAAPYPMLRFMPTGGVNAKNLGEYLAFDKVLACGGSWMVNPELIASGNFAEITRLCKEAVEICRAYR